MKYEQMGAKIFLEQCLRDINNKDLEIEYLEVTQTIFPGDKITKVNVHMKYTVQ
jgi:hypothetical protein